MVIYLSFSTLQVIHTVHDVRVNAISVSFDSIYFSVSKAKVHKDPSEMVPCSLKSKSAADLANAIFTFYQEKGESSADITLICDKKRFHAHKTILAARSDVFSAMFNHSNTEEATTNEVQIEDADPGTLDRLLW